MPYILAAPQLDFLNSYFFMFTTIIVAVVAVIGFLVYRYYLEPPICRQFLAARWKKGTPSFIQDNAGVVHFSMSDKDLPEGIIHNERGYFMLPRAPYLPSETSQQVEKRGVGRPRKVDVAPDTAGASATVAQENEALSTILQVPVLAGLNKAVFFGYDGAPLLCNLKTLAHADLRVMKEIIPATISRTQLSNLVKWATQKGFEKRGGDQMKLIYIAIAAALILGSLGIVAFMILNGGKAAA